MSHYGFRRWTEYVRGQAGGDEAAMRRHLDAGCSSCGRVVSSLRKVVDVAPNEPEATPADDAVERASALSAVPVAERVHMELVWDSARAPWLGGEPGSEARRQLHFAHTEYELDARVDDSADGGPRLSGRLRSRYQHHVDNLAVRLVSRQQVVDAGATGDLGQFDLPLDADEGVELQIALGDDRELIALLSDD